MVSLSDLLRISIPLLRSISEEEVNALVELLEPLPDPDQLPFPPFATGGSLLSGRFLVDLGDPQELPRGSEDDDQGSAQEP